MGQADLPTEGDGSGPDGMDPVARDLRRNHPDPPRVAASGGPDAATFPIKDEAPPADNRGETVGEG